MEEGSLRADINVSVRRPGDSLGTRCEIKNVNSIKFIGMAIEFEARRQVNEIENGREIIQETRLFDVSTGETRSMRSKEEAHDYRYFPDPDLLPLNLEDGFVKEITNELPELPDTKKERLIKSYGLNSYDADILVSDKNYAEYFESTANGRDPKISVNWITGELFSALNKLNLDIQDSPVASDQLGELIDLISDGTLSGRLAKDVFEIMLETRKNPKLIVEEKDLSQITDESYIEKIVDKIIESNIDKVEEAREKPKLIGWFVGQVMKESQGKANPATVNDLVKKKIGI